MDFKDILNVTGANRSEDKIEAEKRLLQMQLDCEDRVLRYIILEGIQGNANPFPFLSQDHFIDHFFGAVYNLIMEFTKDGDRISIGNIASNEFFKDHSDVVDYIQSLDRSDLTHGYVLTESLAYDIDDRYRTRKIKSEFESFAGSIDANKAFREVKKDLQTLNDNLNDITSSPAISHTVFTHQEAMDEFEREMNDKSQVNILTGLNSVDELTGGFGRGELIIFAGATGMGKTSLTMHIMANIAENNHNTLNFSLEMMNKQNISRLISRQTHINNPDSHFLHIPYKDIIKHYDEISGQKAYKDAFDGCRDIMGNIVHDYTPAIKIGDIVSKSEKHAYDLKRQGKTLDFIVIDYLQIIGMIGKKDAHLEIGDITGELKRLAKHLNLTVALLSQINRNVSQGKSIEENRPNSSHLRQSGKIEEDADKILIAFRPSYYERRRGIVGDDCHWEKDYFELIVDKNRGGEVGSAHLKFSMATNYFKDFDYEPQYYGLTQRGITAKGKEGQGTDHTLNKWDKKNEF